MIAEKIFKIYEGIANVRLLDTEIKRCSLANKCIRYLGFKKLGMIGKITARAYMMFKLGDWIEEIVKDDIKKILKQSDDFEFEEKDLDVKVDLGDGIVLSGRLDGFIRLKDSDKYGVVEIKSVSNYAFDEALEGKLNEDYIVQAGLYGYALDVDFVVFLIYRKETSHILEVVFWKHLPYNAEVKLMGNETRDYFVESMPFDYSFLEGIKEKYLMLEKVASIEDVLAIPIPYDFTICQNCDGTGQKEYGKCRSCKGVGRKVDEGGYMVLGFPCSYCPYNILCFPQQVVEFEGLRPKVRVRAI